LARQRKTACNIWFAAIAGDEHVLDMSNSVKLYIFIHADELLLPLRQQAGGRWASPFFTVYIWTKHSKFDIMQAQIEIGYDQLVKLVKQLPKRQWTQLKSEVEKDDIVTDTQSDMLTLLLNGPTFNRKQLDEIAKARKEINQWRTK
jgi:hypothetical protein